MMHRGRSPIYSLTENQRLRGNFEYLLQSISIRWFLRRFQLLNLNKIPNFPESSTYFENSSQEPKGTRDIRQETL